MHRHSHTLACVYLPALPLQIAHKRHDLSSQTPGAVCEGGTIVWPNRMARQAGIRSGMRLAQGRSLSPMLQTATVSAAEQQQTILEIWQFLLGFSPAVEPDAEHAGLFWLDPNGLTHLFGDHAQWCQAIDDGLHHRHYRSITGVGFNRFFTFALACNKQKSFVCDNPAAEATAAHAMTLAQTPLPPALQEALQLLGVASLGEFLRMPVDEIRQCFGAEAERIHRLAHNQTWKPLTPKKWVAPNVAEQQIEPADADAHRLLFAIKTMLQPLLLQLQRACQACVAVHLHLRISAKITLYEHLAAAHPTLDERAIVDLIRLRLTRLPLPGPVECVTLRLESCTVRPEQLVMLQKKPKRDPQAATLALAKIRALMGESAVTFASLQDSHLPEMSFQWELLSHVTLPKPVAALAHIPLVRQVRTAPLALPPPPRRHMVGWLRRDGLIENMLGPYRVHAHWWRQGIERDYYYLQTSLQKLLWVYYSRPQNRWFCHGHVD